MGFLNKLFGWKAGGCIRLGRLDKGFSKLKWLILAVDQKKNKALVISKEPIGVSKFHDDCEPASQMKEPLCWGNSSLRKKLNGSIFDRIFSPEEKEAILTTTVRDGNNPTVQDKLFLLSEKEARQYFADDKARMTSGWAWWLRDTECCAWPSARTVYTTGAISKTTTLADDVFSMRPAMWVDLSKL